MAIKSVQNTDKQSLDRITAASIDQRCHNIRYRQNQLHILHEFLRENAERICCAIQEDSNATKSEALTEYSFAMSAISQLYDELDFDESLKQEYSIARKKSNFGRRIPHGIVIVKPGDFSRVFSIITPLVAAISAGNCVVVELPDTLKQVDQIVKEALAMLDHDAFVVTSSPVTDQRFLSTCLVVNENGAVAPPGHSVHSPDRRTNIALVHRDANVQAAARSLCRARLRFHGHSPYAPDLILVNEWVKNDLLEACLQFISKEAVATCSKRRPVDDPKTSSELKRTSKPSAVDHIYSSSDIQVIELKDRNMITALKPIQGRTLTFLSVTGLTDSVSIASQMPSVLACYTFASLANAKYLCQQIDSSISFVNEIPVHILVGPAVSKALYTSNSDLRYDTFMMSKPHPEYLNVDLPSNHLANELLAEEMVPNSQEESRMEEIKARATNPLRPTGQAAGTSLGFFDQGILTGVIAFVLPTLCLASIGLFYSAKYAYQRLY